MKILVSVVWVLGLVVALVLGSSLGFMVWLVFGVPVTFMVLNGVLHPSEALRPLRAAQQL